MLHEKYHLPGFAFGVDGVLVNFDGMPRGLPAQRTAQSYYSHKHRYAINALVSIKYFSIIILVIKHFLFRLLGVLIACSIIWSLVLQDPGMILLFGGNQK